MNDSLIEIYVEGLVKLSQDELDAANGDVEQAAQNLLGHTSFVVEEADHG